MIAPAIPIVVKVTRNEIINGVKQKCHLCPIALALRRALPEANGVTSYLNSASWYDRKGMRWNADLPHAATTFVVRFDNGEPVQPFEFKIQPVPQVD